GAGDLAVLESSGDRLLGRDRAVIFELHQGPGLPLESVHGHLPFPTAPRCAAGGGAAEEEGEAQGCHEGSGFSAGVHSVLLAGPLCGPREDRSATGHGGRKRIGVIKVHSGAMMRRLLRPKRLALLVLIALAGVAVAELLVRTFWPQPAFYASPGLYVIDP